MSISTLIKNSTQQLIGISDSAKLDAEVLLCHVLKKDRSYLICWPEKEIETPQLKQFENLISQRKLGHPVAHLTQQKEFWSLDLQVNSDTLIPRPETELLVEQILNNYSQAQSISLLDLGTGSGAIALALASERPQWTITATDQSLAALKIAQLNARKLGLSNVQFKSGNWFDAVTENDFDIVVSNPPYIPSSDPHLSQGDVRFEPDSALVSGADGLDDIRLIAQQAYTHIKPMGMLIIEHGYDQKDAVKSIFQQSGFTNIIQNTDLAGHARTSSGIKQ